MCAKFGNQDFTGCIRAQELEAQGMETGRWEWLNGQVIACHSTLEFQVQFWSLKNFGRSQMVIDTKKSLICLCLASKLRFEQSSRWFWTQKRKKNVAKLRIPWTRWRSLTKHKIFWPVKPSILVEQSLKTNENSAEFSLKNWYIKENYSLIFKKNTFYLIFWKAIVFSTDEWTEGPCPQRPQPGLGISC